MTDRAFPASKLPAAASVVSGGDSAAVTGNGETNGLFNQKTQVYNPVNRPLYRPQPYSRHRHHRSRPSCRRICCCCSFWSILLILIAILIAAIAATALYLIYHPRPPLFSVPSLRIHSVNLTTSADSVVSHLSSLFNFTLTAENPNQHLAISYAPFLVTVLSARSGVLLGNGIIPAFFSDNGNKTSFSAVIATSTAARDLDAEEVRNLKSDLQMWKLKSKGVEIRVTCEGFEGTIPKGKTPTIATSGESKCKVDLRVKILKWSF